MVELVFQLTGGHEKGRSGRGQKMRLVREFETHVRLRFNSSIVPAVAGPPPEHGRLVAAHVRDAGDHQAQQRGKLYVEVQQRLAQLRLNFGGTGAKYAEYLGNNQKMISEALLHYQSKLSQYIGADPQVERFWVAAMATTLLGSVSGEQAQTLLVPD